MKLSNFGITYRFGIQNQEIQCLITPALLISAEKGVAFNLISLHLGWLLWYVSIEFTI